MDLRGSLVDVNLKIDPTDNLIKFLKTIPTSYDVPHNILQIIKNKPDSEFKSYKTEFIKAVQLTNSEIERLKQIREKYTEIKMNENNFVKESISTKIQEDLKMKLAEEKLTIKKEFESKLDGKLETCSEVPNSKESDKKCTKQNLNKDDNNLNIKPFLVTSDIDWLYEHIKVRRNNGEKEIPHLHTLLEGVSIKVPENETIKRNPILEARCVKLRAQQESREYRKMTKSVDNVRMRFPEDSISYQLKQLNRQLIAIGQFIISIFAGFLFGFRGVEWMVGNLDFGFRLLLGVMCALIIALAEIYFLAKKLNEELAIPETVQLGGPVKFADQNNYIHKDNELTQKKEHQD